MGNCNQTPVANTPSPQVAHSSVAISIASPFAVINQGSS